jgi:hypothetical protein
MFFIAQYKNGEQVGLIRSGRPCTIRVYETIESARKGAQQFKSFYKEQGIELVIVKPKTFTMELIELID